MPLHRRAEHPQHVWQASARWAKAEPHANPSNDPGESQSCDPERVTASGDSRQLASTAAPIKDCRSQVLDSSTQGSQVAANMQVDLTAELSLSEANLSRSSVGAQFGQDKHWPLDMGSWTWVCRLGPLAQE